MCQTCEVCLFTPLALAVRVATDIAGGVRSRDVVSLVWQLSISNGSTKKCFATPLFLFFFFLSGVFLVLCFSLSFFVLFLSVSSLVSSLYSVHITVFFPSSPLPPPCLFIILFFFFFFIPVVTASNSPDSVSTHGESSASLPETSICYFLAQL